MVAKLKAENGRKFLFEMVSLNLNRSMGHVLAHSKLLDFAHASHVFLVIARDTQVSVVAVIDILFVNAIKAACFRSFQHRDTRRRLTRVCMVQFLR